MLPLVAAEISVAIDPLHLDAVSLFLGYILQAFDGTMETKSTSGCHRNLSMTQSHFIPNCGVSSVSIPIIADRRGFRKVTNRSIPFRGKSLCTQHGATRVAPRRKLRMGVP